MYFFVPVGVVWWIVVGMRVRPVTAFSAFGARLPRVAPEMPVAFEFDPLRAVLWGSVWDGLRGFGFL
jgi:hypothetical protein